MLVSFDRLPPGVMSDQRNADRFCRSEHVLKLAGLVDVEEVDGILDPGDGGAVGEMLAVDQN